MLHFDFHLDNTLLKLRSYIGKCMTTNALALLFLFKVTYSLIQNTSS